MYPIESTPLVAQTYANNAADTQFALDCFNSLIPELPKCIVGVVNSIRGSTSICFKSSEHPVPTSLDSSCNIIFDTSTMHYPGLELLVEGATVNLKSSGAEHRLMHIQRMLAGLIIGSEIAENVDKTIWRSGDTIIQPSLPEFTQIFDRLAPQSDTPAPDPRLGEILEDQSIAAHYRFAATSGLFVLSKSLSNMGALGGDTISIYNRVRRRLGPAASKLGGIVINEALIDSLSPYSHNLEQGLSVLALGNTFSLEAYLNSLTHFIPIDSKE